MLPILDRGRLVGRLDAKAHRAEGRFEVKALFLEGGIEITDVQVGAVAHAIVECARWHGTPTVEIGRCAPRAFKRPLQTALKQANG